MGLFNFLLVAVASIAVVTIPSYYYFKNPSIHYSATSSGTRIYDSISLEKLSHLKSAFFGKVITPLDNLPTLLDELQKINPSDPKILSDPQLSVLHKRKNDIVIAEKAISKINENYRFTADEILALKNLKEVSITCFGDIEGLLKNYGPKMPEKVVSGKSPDLKRSQENMKSFEGSASMGVISPSHSHSNTEPLSVSDSRNDGEIPTIISDITEFPIVEEVFDVKNDLYILSKL